jgi:hypothetical protein
VGEWVGRVLTHTSNLLKLQGVDLAGKSPITVDLSGGKNPTIREACVTDQLTSNLSLKLRDLIKTTTTHSPECSAFLSCSPTLKFY